MGVGRRLRQAREARGLSMADVAGRTKIPVRQLAALEAEEYEHLPGGVFVRGHIRASAQAVGLDPRELVEHFDEERNPPPLAPLGQQPSIVEDRGPRLHMAAEPRTARPAGPVIAALAILISIVLALAWLGRDRQSLPSSRREASPVTPISERQPQPAPKTGADESTAVGTSGVKSVVAAGPVQTERDGVALSLRADRVCWLSLTVDGQRVAYRMLQAGDTIAAQMRQRASLRTGDAGALTLSVDGRPARPLGASGVVRSVEIMPDGEIK